MSTKSPESTQQESTQAPAPEAETGTIQQASSAETQNQKTTNTSFPINKRLIAGILLLALPALAVSVYFIFFQQPDIGPGLPPEDHPFWYTSKTADWKAYSNPAYGYQIKYPNESPPQEYTDNDIFLHHVTFGEPFSESIWFSLIVREENLEEAIEFEKWQASHLLVTLTEEKETTIDNHPAVLLTYESQRQEPQRSTTFAILYREPYAYTISSKTEDIDLILSTFELSNKTADSLGWRTYTHGEQQFSLKYPHDWIKKPILIQGSGFTQEFESSNGLYKFTISVKGNYNQITGEPHETLEEYLGTTMSKAVTVFGQPAKQPLPKAGSENIYSTVFFSNDATMIYTLTLQVGDNIADERVTASNLQAAEEIFNQILSTFTLFE